MIEGVVLHRGVLWPSTVREVWAFLLSLPYTRIERPAMHLSRSLQDNNKGNEQAAWLVEKLKPHVGNLIAFDDVSVVRYDNASDYVDWHSDGGPLLEPGCAMGVLSFGASRVMEFRERGVTEAAGRVLLEENDLIVSRAGFQETHEHKIPASETGGLRISVVLFTHNKKPKKK